MEAAGLGGGVQNSLMSNKNLGLVSKFKLSSEFPWRQTENFSYIISTAQSMLGIKNKKEIEKI